METTIKAKPSQLERFSMPPSGGFLGPTDSNCAVQIAHSHPLKKSEADYEKHQQTLNYQMLRNREGLHAPLKLAMELRAASKVGRLPFLASSNIQRDILLGRDEIIDFSDFLGTPDVHEVMQQPHAVVEGILKI